MRPSRSVTASRLGAPGAKGASAPAGFDIRALHRRNGRSQAHLAEFGQRIEVVVKPALAQCRPGDLACCVLADQFLLVGFSHRCFSIMPGIVARTGARNTWPAVALFGALGHNM